MRGLESFGPVDLASHCTEDLAAKVAGASAYAQALLRGGQALVLPPFAAENGQDRVMMAAFGFQRLFVRPQHPVSDPRAQATFRKSSPQR